MRADQKRYHPVHRLWPWLLFFGLLASTAYGATVRDEFIAVAYDQQNGTAQWVNDWQEQGDNDSPNNGGVRVSNDTVGTDRMLQFRSGDVAITRSADLTGATGIELSLTYRRVSLDGTSDNLQIYARDQGGSWTEVGRIEGDGNDSSYRSFQVNLNTFNTGITDIAFQTSSTVSGNDRIFVDDVQILYTPPATTGAVAYYSFDTDAADAVGGNDGTFVGNPSLIPARICDGVSLNGTNQSVAVPDSAALDISTALTVSAWVRHRTGSGFKSWETILAKGDGTYRLHLNGGCGSPGPRNGFTFGLNGGCGPLDVSSQIVPQAGVWYHVAATYDGSTSRIYVHDTDGNLLDTQSSAPGVAIRTDNQALWIGDNSQRNGRNWNGDIDEVIVRNDVLSQADINTLAAATNPCALPTPVAEWRFDECGYDGSAQALNSVSSRYPLTPRNVVLSGEPGVIERYADTTDTGVRDNHFELTDTLALPGDWTVSTWFRKPFTGNHRYHVLGSFDGGGDLLYLDRNRNYEWGVYTVSPNRVSRGSFRFGTLSDGWHQLTIVGEAGQVSLYIDGVSIETVNAQATGDLRFIGTSWDYVGNPNSSQGFGTPFDEWVVWDSALTASEVQLVFNYQNTGRNLDGLIRPQINCNPSVDHFLIVHDGNALTCAPETVEIRACGDAACTPANYVTTDMQLSLSPAGWVGGDNPILSGGIGSFRLRHTIAEEVTLGVTTSDLAIVDEPASCQSPDGDCRMTFHQTGFLFDVPHQTSCQTSADVRIQAVQLSDTDQTCVGVDSFADVDRSLRFWSSYDSPASGGRSVQINGTAITTSAPGTALPLSFGADASSNFTVRYADAGRLGLTIEFDGEGEEVGLHLEGTDTFVVRPARFDLSATSDGTSPLDNTSFNGSPFHAAGDDFEVSVRAVCDDGALTPNFAAPVRVETADPFAPSAGIRGELSHEDLATADFSGGVASLTTAYSEVGAVTLSATATDYLASGLAVGGQSPLVGRFIPHHFVASVNDPEFNTGCSSFTYLAQPFSYVTAPSIDVTAYNANGQVTTNYTGDWWKLGAASLTDEAGGGTSWYSVAQGDLNTVAATGPLSTDQGGGSSRIDFGGHLSFDRSLPQAPFDAEIRLALNVQDGDGVAAVGNPIAFGAASAGNGIPFSSGKQMRFGRLALSNAFGPEIHPLNVPAHAEFFDGVGFAPNTADQCTVIDDSQIQLTNAAGAMASGGVPIDVQSGHSTTAIWVNRPLVNGDGGFYLTAPGSGGEGHIDLALDLSSLPWLQFDWLNLDGAADGPYTDNPTAQATFGVFKGNPRVIYRRESVD